MPAAFSNPSTWAPMLIVFAIGLSALVAYGVASAAVRRAIRENDVAFERGLDAALQGGPKRTRRLTEQLLVPLARLLMKAPGERPSRWVVHGTPTELQAAYLTGCDEALRLA